MLQRILIFALTTYSIIGFADDNAGEPPRNNFLADSPWPMTHRNPYCQASSPLPGPNASDVDQKNYTAKLATAEAVPITLNISPKNVNGQFSIWASARNSLFKLDGNGSHWLRTESIDKSDRVRSAISGAYTVLDRDGNLFVPRGASILVYQEAASGLPDSTILKENVIKLPRTLLISDDEIIVGINMTYDGHLVVVTNRAFLAIFGRNGELKSHIRLSVEEQVSNSLALDEDGGIYIVTHKQIYRVNWNLYTLKIAWSSNYPTTTKPLPGRLGLGSGTTPTLMGSGAEDKLVVIADGTSLMNIMAFWRDQIPVGWQAITGFSSRVAGIAPIRFGNPEIKRSITEQSLVVRGYEAVAVNNDYGEIPADERSNFWTILFSNRKRYAPYGIEKFKWDTKERKILTVWSNPRLSVPNGIPAMSSATGLMYYIGQHNEQWTIEAVDWRTGALSFRYFLNDAVKFNSFFAGIEVGYHSDLMSGVVGGALKFAAQKSE